MAETFQSIVASVKEAVNIIDVIEAGGTQLNRSGVRYKGLCPFHSEKTPSFVVNEDTQSYHCFGCGEHGDVFTFVQKTNSTDFVDSLRIVGSRPEAGIDIDGELDRVFSSGGENAVDYKRLRACNQEAYKFFQSAYRLELLNLRTARENSEEYLSDMIEFVKGKRLPLSNLPLPVGYADDSKTSLVEHLVDAGYTHEEIVTCGLAIKRDNGSLADFFVHRAIFTFTDSLGRPVGFAGRLLNKERTTLKGKYVNTKETPLFKKSRLFYGMDKARSEIVAQKKVFVVEGQTDVIAMHLMGATNTVAAGGTSITAEHISLLSRLVGAGGKIIFLLDGDFAGQNAMKKSVLSFEEVQDKGYTISLPPGYDPCDLRARYIKKWGGEVKKSEVKERFRKIISSLEEKKMVHASTFIAEFFSQDEDEGDGAKEVDEFGIARKKSSGEYEKINRFVAEISELDNLVFVEFTVKAFAPIVHMSTSVLMDKIRSRGKESGAKKKRGEPARNEGRSDVDELFIPESVEILAGEEVCDRGRRAYSKMRKDPLGVCQLRLTRASLLKPGAVRDKSEEHITITPLKSIISTSKKLRRASVPESYGKKLSVIVALCLSDDTLLADFEDIDQEEFYSVLDHNISTIHRIQGGKEKKMKRREWKKLIDKHKNGDISLAELESQYEKLFPRGNVAENSSVGLAD